MISGFQSIFTIRIVWPLFFLNWAISVLEFLDHGSPLGLILLKGKGQRRVAGREPKMFPGLSLVMASASSPFCPFSGATLSSPQMSSMSLLFLFVLFKKKKQTKKNKTPENKSFCFQEII